MSYHYLPSIEKETKFIFDNLESSKNPNSFGYLSLMFQVFKVLAESREQKRLSQRDLAKKSGIHYSVIARIESGRGNPTLLQLIRIAHALDMKIKFETMTKKELEDWKDVDMEGYME